VRPFFREGKLFCWLASAGHWLDIGGNVPGGYNPIATESFQEGMRMPVVLLNDDIKAILAANSRLPLSNWGDMNGQLNALHLGEKRLTEIVDQYGEAIIKQAFTAFSKRAEIMMREALLELPDAEVSFEDYLDNDGIIDEKITIALDLTLKGDHLTLDFSRSSPHCLGALNISKATSIAACYVALKHIFLKVPANAGCLKPISFVLPENSILNAHAPKPMAGYTETILRLMGVIFGAIGKIAPTKSYAAPFGTINALSIAGYRENGARWVMFSFFGGGLGGSHGSDGLNHANNPISTATIPPLEILEAAYPVRFKQWALRENSEGAGEFRGGLGAIYEIEVLDERGAEVFLLGERGKYAPFGLNGGEEAALNRFSWKTAKGKFTPPFASKITGVKLKKGESVCLETPGGGGYGLPSSRDKARVRKDLALGYISKKRASVYGGVK
jgi:N-methylhydantoinase B